METDEQTQLPEKLEIVPFCVILSNDIGIN